jgi:hypothetical protein
MERKFIDFMKPEIKQLWMAALRSGKYEQGQHALRNSSGGYCCLGVLCNLFHEVTGEGRWDDNTFVIDEDDMNDQVPPNAVVAWAELSEANPTISSDEDDQDSLAHVNDQGASFDDIANIIEEQL